MTTIAWIFMGIAWTVILVTCAVAMRKVLK